MTSLATLLTDPGGGRPVALRGGSVLGLDRLRADVARFAARAAGYRRGAIVCADRYAFAVILFGLLHAGAEVVVPVNGRSGTLHQLSDRFDTLFGDDAIASLEGAAPALRPLDPDRLCVDFYTSGSTGAPKPISKSLAMLTREAQTLDGVWAGRRRDAPVLTTVSQQHFYGFMFGLVLPLIAHQPFAVETHEVWESLLAAMPPGATLVTSPSHLTRLGGIKPLAPAERPAQIFSAGAPLPEWAAAESAAVLGMAPDEIFGSTETGVIATRRESAPWRPLPGIELRTDEDGRLSVRSPYVGPDWYQTADVVALTEEGFQFRGRSDDIVKIEGKRVNLREVTGLILGHPWVADAAVFVMPGERELLAAVVVPSAEGRTQLASAGPFRTSRLLRRALADSQEPAAMPRRWRFVEALPTRDMGKRSRADLEALFGPHHETT